MTGVSFLSTEVVTKRLELLRELVPGATRVAVLVNPAVYGECRRHIARSGDGRSRPWGCKFSILNASTTARSTQPSRL